jgi:hypothetical protein
MLEELSNEEILTKYLLPPSAEQVFIVCYACREFPSQHLTVNSSWNRGRSQGTKGRSFEDRESWYYELVYDQINPISFVNLESVPKKLRAELKRMFNHVITRRELIDWLVGYCLSQGYIIPANPELSIALAFYLTDKGYEVVSENLESIKCFYTARVLTRGLVILDNNE